MADATDDRLRLLIERIERLEEEKKGIAEDIRDVYAEAKAVGYDAKIMRQVVRERKMKPDDRAEMAALLDTNRCAVGLDFSHTPLGAAIERETAREQGPPDERYEAAKRLVISHSKASASWLQRQLGVGYNTAAQLIERMEQDGLVSAPGHTGARSVNAEVAATAH